MPTKMLSASLENYLEAIYHIVAARKVARPRDISQRLGVNNSSVTGALHSLADKALVNYAPFDVITLTDQGERIARSVVRRHEAIKDFFVKVLSIDEAEADEAACKIEHVISPTIHERFVEFLEFVEVCPRGGTEWIKSFGFRCSHGQNRLDCERCIQECLDEVHHQNDDARQADPIPLSSLQTGQKGLIARISATGSAGSGLAELGIETGGLIEIENNIEDAELIEVKIKGYHHKLNQSQAEGIFVDRL